VRNGVMAERQDELNEQAREWYEEQAKREAEYKVGVRDTKLLEMFTKTDKNAHLFREIFFQLQQRPD
jgi:hypothetical protein